MPDYFSRISCHYAILLNVFHNNTPNADHGIIAYHDVADNIASRRNCHIVSYYRRMRTLLADCCILTYSKMMPYLHVRIYRYAETMPRTKIISDVCRFMYIKSNYMSEKNMIINQIRESDVFSPTLIQKMS